MLRLSIPIDHFTNPYL